MTRFCDLEELVETETRFCDLEELIETETRFCDLEVEELDRNCDQVL